MPLLSPHQIHEVLKVHEPEQRQPASQNEKQLAKLLENANLSLPEVLENLSNNMRCGDTGSVRMKATETALKLNGVLSGDKDDSNKVNVTIVISDHVGINPILIPRHV